MVHAIGEIRCPLCLSPCPLVPTPHPPSPTNVTPSCGSLMQLQRAIVGEPNVSLLRSGRVMAAKSPAGFRHDPPDPLPLCSRCLDRGASDASRGYASLPAPEAVGLTVHPRLSPFKEYPAIVDFVCSLQNSSMAHLPQHGARAGMPQRQGSVGPWYQPQRHQVHRMGGSSDRLTACSALAGLDLAGELLHRIAPHGQGFLAHDRSDAEKADKKDSSSHHDSMNQGSGSV